MTDYRLKMQWTKAATMLVAPTLLAGCGMAEHLSQGFTKQAVTQAHETKTLSELELAAVSQASAAQVEEAAPMAAAPLAVVDLTGALRGLLSDNPRLAADIERQRAVTSGVHAARGRYVPEVALTGGYGASRRDENFRSPTPDRLSEENPWDYRAEIRIPLYQGGQLLAGLRQALARESAGRNQSDAVRQQVMLDASEAYLALLRDEAVARLRGENLAIVQRIRDGAEAQFKIGSATRTDVALSDAQLAFAQAQLDQDQGQREASRTAYVRQFGAAPNGALSAPRVDESGLPRTSEDAAQRARQNSPRLRAAQEEARAQGFAARQARGAAMPNVNLVISHGRNADDWIRGQFEEETRAAVRVSVPLAPVSSISEARAARATAAQRRYEAQDIERAAVQEAASAFELFQAQKRRVASLTARADAALRAAQGVQREYQGGTRSIIDLLQAEEQAVQARIDVERAAYDRMLAALRLLAATGQLTPETVG
jgi:TolC family type I secretion outer membrane protein